MKSYSLMEDITSKMHELQEQYIKPKYISLNTKAMITALTENHYKVPYTIFGLEILYNPQQTTMVRIIAENPEKDFLARRERYL